MSWLSPSGRPPVPKKKEKSQLNMDNEEDQLQLLRCIAKGNALTSLSQEKPKRYQPLFKHPLPTSDHSSYHMANYRRVTCCQIPRQAAAAVTAGDSWVLEELIMQGAPINVSDQNGFSPIHIAVQLNSFECVMVLINAGVHVNATTLSGVTPLFLAVAAGANECAGVLRENGGLMEIDLSGEAAPIQALDVNGLSKYTLLDELDDRAGNFKRHTLY